MEPVVVSCAWARPPHARIATTALKRNRFRIRFNVPSSYAARWKGARAGLGLGDWMATSRPNIQATDSSGFVGRQPDSRTNLLEAQWSESITGRANASPQMNGAVQVALARPAALQRLASNSTMMDISSYV